MNPRHDFPHVTAPRLHWAGLRRVWKAIGGCIERSDGHLWIEVPHGFGGTRLLDHLCSLHGWNGRAIEVIDGRETGPARQWSKADWEAVVGRVVGVEVEDMRGGRIVRPRITRHCPQPSCRIVLHDGSVTKASAPNVFEHGVFARLDGVLLEETSAVVAQWLRLHADRPVSRQRRQRMIDHVQRRMWLHRHRAGGDGEVGIVTMLAWLKDADRAADREPRANQGRAGSRADAA